MGLVEFAESQGATVGAAESDVLRLERLIGRPLPVPVRSYLCSVGGAPVDGRWRDRLEWGVEAGHHSLASIGEILEFHETPSSAVWLAEQVAPWLMIGVGDPHGGVIAVLLEGKDPGVFHVPVGSPIAREVFAGSFTAFERGLVLPEPLVDLAAAVWESSVSGSISVAIPEVGLDPTRAIVFIDNALDSLLAKPLPARSSRIDDVRRTFVSPDNGIFGVRSTEQQRWPRGVSARPGNLLQRFGALSALLLVAAAADQLGEPVEDELLLFGPTNPVALSGREVVEELLCLAPADGVDHLADRFRAKLAVPCAERLLAQARGV